MEVRITRMNTRLAGLAIVIVAIDSYGADKRDDVSGTVCSMAFGIVLATRTDDARPSIPPFFPLLQSGLESFGTDLVDEVSEDELIRPEDGLVGRGGELIGDRLQVAGDGFFRISKIRLASSCCSGVSCRWGSALSLRAMMTAPGGNFGLTFSLPPRSEISHQLSSCTPL